MSSEVYTGKFAQLEQQSHHESITLAPFELRPFSIVVGRNGAGKSTLVQIVQHLVQKRQFHCTDAASSIMSNVKTARVLKSDNFRPSDDGPRFKLHLECKDEIYLFAHSKLKESFLSEMEKQQSSDTEPHALEQSLEYVFRATNNEFEEMQMSETSHSEQSAAIAIRVALDRASFSVDYDEFEILDYSTLLQTFLTQPRRTPKVVELQAIIQRRPLSGTVEGILTGHVSRFDNKRNQIMRKFEESGHVSPSWDEVMDLFQQDEVFSKIKKILSDLNSPLMPELSGTETLQLLKPVEHKKQLSNQSKHSLTVHWKDVETGHTRSFGTLSPGEQLQLTLRFHLAGFESKILTPRQPDTMVLLLDEADAFLDPILTEDFVSFLRDEICRKHQIWVLMTTHKLSTMALAEPGELMAIKDG